jgi:hypothetical protein
VRAWARGDVPERELARLVGGAIDAYDLVDHLPRGEARAAAWAAYALQTYGDKLIAAGRAEGYVTGDTVHVASRAFELAAQCMEAARDDRRSTVLPTSLPRWSTAVRSEEQLAGMRDALEALWTYVAFDLNGRPSAGVLRERLSEVDDDLAVARRLWMPRPPAEIAGGIADALTRGLDRVYDLGRASASA